MYNVSATYKEAILKLSVKTRITGMIGSQAITNDDIVAGSLSISSQCIDKSDLNLGSVFSSQLSINLFYEKSDYQKLNGSLIALSFGIMTSENEWENVPLGVYKVAEVARGINTVKLIAYDLIMNFNKEFISPDTASRTPYEWLSYACQQCGVDIGMTSEEMSALPNCQAYSVPDSGVIATYSDLLSNIAAISGCFAYISKNGTLRLKQIKSTPSVAAIPKNLRNSTEISDFDIHFSAVTMQKDNNTYGACNGDGRLLAIGEMPLLEDFASEKTTYEAACENILGGLSTITYTPFTVKWPGDPSIEVGDFITISDVNGEDLTSIVTHYQWVYRGQSKIWADGSPDDTMANSSSGTNRSSTQNAKDIIAIKGSLKNYATKDYVDERAGGLKNLLDGSQNGSVRSSLAATEDEYYKMGYGATALGKGSKSKGTYSFANGLDCSAEGEWSTAFGNSSKAKKYGSYASGYACEVNHDYACAFGRNVISGRKNQMAAGEYNEGRADTIFEIGNGTSDSNRSNAFAMTTDGGILAKRYMIHAEYRDTADSDSQIAQNIATFNEFYSAFSNGCCNQIYLNIGGGDIIFTLSTFCNGIFVFEGFDFYSNKHVIYKFSDITDTTYTKTYIEG